VKFPVKPPVLALADLESNDPHGGRSAGSNRRYLCPLCGDGKKRDAAHRSLSLAMETGLWNCHRCGASGQLTEHQVKREGQGTKEKAKANRARLSQLQTYQLEGHQSQTCEPGQGTSDETSNQWRDRLKGLQPLVGTQGEDYLRSRGISLEVAILAGLRFAPEWFGRPAVVFPIRDLSGSLVAAQGRHIAGTGKLTCGPKSQGVFFAPTRIDIETNDMETSEKRVFRPLDRDVPAVIICEAPIDALSLAMCGFPALALCGVNGAYTSGPPWLHLACGLRRVVLAFDNDAAGQEAATSLVAKLSPFGARCERLQPEGAKDWNEALETQGREALADWLQWQLQEK
jgi:hypothetical protein